MYQAFLLLIIKTVHIWYNFLPGLYSEEVLQQRADKVVVQVEVEVDLLDGQRHHRQLLAVAAAQDAHALNALLKSRGGGSIKN